jgi:hypothetical protein
MAVLCTSLVGQSRFDSVLFKAHSESVARQSLHANFRDNSASLTSKGHQQTSRLGILIGVVAVREPGNRHDESPETMTCISAYR